MWAIGGTGVLAKQALAYLFIPGRRQGAPSGGGFFARNVSLRKIALAAGAAYALAALIFFAAPPFRQGLRASLGAWSDLLYGTVPGQGELRSLARRAEARHDPEGLIFAAARLWDGRESARLVEKAIRLDSRFLWAYAVVAERHGELAEISQWVPKLEAWNPENAVSYLLAADLIERSSFNTAPGLPPMERQRALQKDAAWRRDMEVAFASPAFDDYSDRLTELDRRVVTRYDFQDLFAVLWGEQGPRAGVVPFHDSQEFAKSLLQAGENLESQGDRNGAFEKCWAVARFGQVIDSQGHNESEHWAGTALQAMAYKQLQRLSSQGGNASEAALFGYLAAKFDPVPEMRARRAGSAVFAQEIFRRNAAVLQISSLMMFLFSALLVIAAPVLMIRSSRVARTAAPRAVSAATAMALISAVGLLVSCATLYLTYRPYWYIFQRAVLTGDASQNRDLLLLLMAARAPFGLAPYGRLSLNLPVYFWASVILLGIIGLILILLRHFRVPPRANGLQHPHVP
jgi:hypothetical protein